MTHVVYDIKPYIIYYIIFIIFYYIILCCKNVICIHNSTYGIHVVFISKCATDGTSSMIIPVDLQNCRHRQLIILDLMRLAKWVAWLQKDDAEENICLDIAVAT